MEIEPKSFCKREWGFGGEGNKLFTKSFCPRPRLQPTMIAVVAPAGRISREKFEEGLACLWELSGEDVKVMPHVFSEYEVGYLSASMEERAADLMSAWLDPEVTAIVCARGGFGSAQLLNLLDWDLLRERPDMPVIGYSDITALHFGMVAKGVGIPVIAPMIGTLPEALQSAYTGEMFQAMLSGRSYELMPPSEFGDFNVIKPGNVTGKLLAGNLAVAVTLCGTPYFPDVSDRVLMFEDLNEPLYKLDRYFTQLEMCGILRSCRGLLLGQFTDCAPQEELNALFERIAPKVNGPVISNLPFGHVYPLASQLLG